MSKVSVDLGTIKVAGKRPDLSLTLSGSFSVALPLSLLASPTSGELCRASSSGQIWIAKAGSCRIDVLTLVNGQVPDTASLDPSIMTAIADFTSDLPVWICTGLELRANHKPHNWAGQSHAFASYFLHHPDLSSEMIAPSGIPLAQFEGLRCQVNYCFKSANSQTHSTACGSELPLDDSVPITEPEDAPASQGHSYHLRNNPRRSRKAAVAQEMIDATVAGSSSSASRSASNCDKTNVEDIESLVSEAIADMACLLDFSFRKLIGVNGPSPGFRTIKSTASPSLIDIAPAVWNLHYLRTMSVHARIIPSISAGIARLGNAQSASLRTKLEALRTRHVPDGGSPSSADAEPDVAGEVGKCLWLLCQTRIRPRTTKGPCVTAKAKQDTTERPAPQLLSIEYELDASPEHLDGFDDHSVEIEEYGLLADQDCYAALPGGFSMSDHEHEYLLPEDETGVLEEQGSSEAWMQSSEGDYFYTDGRGNVYPIESQAVPEDSMAEWPARQHSSDRLSQEEFEQVEEYDDEDAEQRYIMYHEAQDSIPMSGMHIDLNTPNQTFPVPSLPYPSEVSSSDWAGDQLDHSLSPQRT